jgi:lipopolysaccharide export system protein LptC
MRLLILSVAGGLVLAGVAWAQSSGSDSGSSSGSGVSQLPVGQVYKDFQFPYYENGVLKFTMTADDAKGITISRAETTNLKIDLYENGKVTTTITSPKADLYVADRKLRTHNTVLISRADLDATAQFCDFDLVAKQYTLRNNVKVTLKNFDAGKGTPTPAAAAAGPPPLQPAPVPPESTERDEMLLNTPGAYSSTNAPPANAPSSSQ